jgi:diguanylate cyclase (GGDEF)-like protein
MAYASVLADWVLGRNAKCRLGVVNSLLIAQACLVGLFLLLLTGDQGPQASPQVAALYVYCITGMLGFYCAIRTGLTASYRDPGLTVAHAWFYVLAIALAFAVSPIARSVCVELMLVLGVFYMRSLTRGQVRALTWGTTILMALVLIYLSVELGPKLDWFNELLNIALIAVVLPILSAAARDMQRLRRARIMQHRELSKVQSQLRELSTLDTLTALLNRRQMQLLLDEEAKRQGRSGQALSVAVVDLDHFKDINELYGNQVGDDVLRDVSRIMTRILRNIDLASRWSGQQFLILMPDTTTAQAMQAMERLRLAVVHHAWAALGANLKVEFSAGVCQHPRGGDINLTIERAILAMQAAKAAGRGRSQAAKEDV